MSIEEIAGLNAKQPTSKPRYSKVGYICSAKQDLTSVGHELERRYNFFNLRSKGEVDPDLIIAIGGDGFMLNILHSYLSEGTPIYGLNYGTYGFFLNKGSVDNLLERIESATVANVPVLKMVGYDRYNKEFHGNAINEISLLRDTPQAAHLKITINGKVRINDLAGDGMLISTPLGSTAYNSSAGGSILPLYSHLLSLTAINSFLPKGFKSSLIYDDSVVEIEIMNYARRSVTVAADFHEFRHLQKVLVSLDSMKRISLLFDNNLDLEERIMREQFEGR